MTVYKITYLYKDKIIQEKELITKDRFNGEYSFFKKAIHLLECKKPSKSQKEELKLWENELFTLKKEFKKSFPLEIFVIDSPLYQAIETGILVLPKIQGGKHYVNIEKL